MYSPDLSLMTRPSDLSGSAISAVSHYFDNREKMIYYRNRPPFTSLTYHSGAKKEEGIDVIHSRNFSPNLNMAVHFNKNASNGFYNHMRTASTYFSLNLNYSTRNQRYTLMSHYYYNRKQLQENGGFTEFSEIQDPSTTGSSRLNTAASDLYEEGFFLSQTLGIGNTADTSAPVIRPVFRLGHDLFYISGRRKYEDHGNAGYLDTSFYRDIYFDSTSSLDTNLFNQFSNQFNLFIYPGRQLAKTYYRNEIIHYRQGPLSDTIYQNHFAGLEWTSTRYSGQGLFAKTEYALSGFREGDISAEAGWRKSLEDSAGRAGFDLSLYYTLNNPQVKQLFYASNNHAWSNDFNKTQYAGFRFQGERKGLGIRLDAGQVTNYIYYDSLILPAQVKEGITFISAGMEKLLSFKFIHLDNRILYQYSSNLVSMPLPEWTLFESLYFSGRLFKRVVTFQTGFDIYYFTGFRGLAYSPSLGEFHIQRNEMVGNYPFIDFFFTFQLKRACIFAKVEHFNRGMSGDNFYQVPGYPVPPRAFKWGLRWLLSD